MNARICIVGLAALLFSVIGCGGASSSETTVPQEPPPPLTAPELLPSDAFAVIELDLVRLRDSSNWDLFEALLLTAEENVARAYPSLGGGELRRWVGLADRIWVGIAPSNGDGEDPDVFVVAEGRFTVDEAVVSLDRLAADDPRLTRREDASVTTYRGEEPFEELALLEDGLAVTATSGRIDEVVTRYTSRQGQSPLAGAEMAAIAERVSFGRDAFGAAVVFTPEAKAFAMPRIDPRARPVLDAASAGAVRIGVGDGVDALAIISTDSPAVVTGAVAEIEGQRDFLSRQPVVSMMGLDPLIAGLGATAEGGDLRISLRTNHQDARNVLGRVSGFVGLALGAMLGEGPPRDSPPLSEAQ